MAAPLTAERSSLTLVHETGLLDRPSDADLEALLDPVRYAEAVVDGKLKEVYAVNKVSGEVKATNEKIGAWNAENPDEAISFIERPDMGGWNVYPSAGRISGGYKGPEGSFEFGIHEVSPETSRSTDLVGRQIQVSQRGVGEALIIAPFDTDSRRLTPQILYRPLAGGNGEQLPPAWDVMQAARLVRRFGEISVPSTESPRLALARTAVLLDGSAGVVFNGTPKLLR